MSGAVESLFDGAQTGKREQRIYTPIEVVRRLHTLWPEGIACDPCSGPDSLVDADLRAYPESDERPDGLAFAWPARTYINPPFDNYAAFLGRFIECHEAVLLGPVRSHRTWYRDTCRTVAAFVDCDPVKFVGYAHGFPAPIRILYRGEQSHRFARIFGDLGSAHVGELYNVARAQVDLFA